MDVPRISAVFALVMLGCASPDGAARTDPIGPDRTTFRPVSLVLQRRCGSLDCHGTRFRNFRLYGYGGLRLDPNDRPDAPIVPSQAEVDANYDAFIGLEPELTRAVVTSGGKDATRLTVVRKGRGDEDHKGDRRIVPGSDADRCILTWLSGAIDAEACKRAQEEF